MDNIENLSEVLKLVIESKSSDKNVDMAVARLIGAVIPAGKKTYPESRSIEEWDESAPAYTDEKVGPGLVIAEIERLFPDCIWQVSQMAGSGYGADIQERISGEIIAEGWHDTATLTLLATLVEGLITRAKNK